MSQILTKFIEDGAVSDAKILAGVDAAKIADGSVSNAEFQFINTLSSNAQTQISARALSATTITALANGGLTGGGDLSANRTFAVSPNNATVAAPVAADEILFGDISDSNNVKKTTIADIVALASGSLNNKQTFVLAGGDITNQYLDLAQVAKTGSINFIVKGAGSQLEGASYDYSVSYTGGVGGVTRITFLNDLATGGPAALVATNVVQVQYEY